MWSRLFGLLFLLYGIMVGLVGEWKYDMYTAVLEACVQIVS